MNIMVRNYQGSDYQGLIYLLGNVYDSEIPKDVLESNYLSSSRSILVAINENSLIVGCAFIEIQTDYVRPKKIAYITYVAVDVNYRKQGIGKKLMSAVEGICIDKGCSAIELTSANFRTGAHAFYESLGFTRKKTTVFIREIV